MNYCPDCGVPLRSPVTTCPTCQTETAAVQPQPREVRRTIVEKVEPVVPSRMTVREAKPKARVLGSVEKTETGPFRPLNRPPMALLTALDDGSKNKGEVWRVRGPRHVIGRAEGDTLIPHDLDISARHAEITCRWMDGRYRWHLQDLESTNGTFLRVSKVPLRHGKEVLLGSRRYEFRIPQEKQDAPPETSEAKVTHKYQGLPATVHEQAFPRFVELDSQGDVHEFLLTPSSHFIGHDPATCGICVSGDSFVSEKHARLWQDDRERWMIEDCQSTNGIWVSVQRLPLETNSEFQLGEQRFRFTLL